MAQLSSIEWTEITWNPVVGCTKVSAGCKNCYAERMAKRLAAIAGTMVKTGKNPGRSLLYRDVVNHRGRWSGDVALNEESLKDPYRWRGSKRVFVNSMSDLFHEHVPTDFIQHVFEVMHQCPQHTFQVLTKRPERVALISDKLSWSKNIWMGTSVENNDVLDRISYLQRVPAEVRFLSIEPLLGAIPQLPLAGIHWVIVGGESGPGARAIDSEWVVQIRDRCLIERVPFFFKQWGGINKKRTGRELEGQTWDEMPSRDIAYA